jgi:hypothetical protein
LGENFEGLEHGLYQPIGQVRHLAFGGIYPKALVTNNVFDRLQNLCNCEPIAAPQIAVKAIASLEKTIERRQVRLRKIRQVDVIANAGSVPCVLVITKQLHWSTQARRRFEGIRNQVSFGIMFFTDEAVPVRPRSIEIA